jgi:hypothetical protein
MRESAGDCFVFAGLLYGHLQTTDDYLRAAHNAMLLGADAVYCAAGTEIVSRLSAEGIPVCGHTGLIPSNRTWTGGFKVVGRTAESARLVYDQVKTLEAAGAFAAEIEVVPGASCCRNREANIVGVVVHGRWGWMRCSVPLFPPTYWVTPTAMHRAIPSSTEISRPNTNAFSLSESPHSANSRATSAAEVTRRASTTSSSTIPNSLHSWPRSRHPETPRDTRNTPKQQVQHHARSNF